MENEKTEIVNSKSSRTPLTSRQKKMIIVAGLIVIPLALIMSFRGLFIAATVDGNSIPRLQVIKELERQGGKAVLDSLITDILIDNKAKEQGVVVEEREINEEIAKIKESVGDSFTEALAQQGLTEESLRKGIQKQLLLRKLLAEQLVITDEEIEQYLTENDVALPEEEDPEIREQIRQQLIDQKFSQEAEGLILTLRAEANIVRYVNY